MRRPSIPRPKLPRRSGTEAEPTTEQVQGAATTAATGQPTTPGAAPGTGPAGAKAGASAEAPTAVPKPAIPVRPPTVEERIDGLGGWLAQLDRKLAIRTYTVGAALVLALAAAGVALVLILQLRDDAATKDDVRQLSEQIAAVETSAVEQAQQDLEALSDRLTQLEQKVGKLEGDQSTTQQQLEVVQNDIQDLRSQISDLESLPPVRTPTTPPPATP